MNAQVNSYKSKSSATRAAKKAFGDEYTVIENADGTFSYVEGIGMDCPTDNPDGSQPGGQADEAPEATDEQLAAIEQAGDNVANGLTVTEAPPSDKPKLDVKRKSDIAKPTKKVWAFAEGILATEPNIRRKDMIDRLVAMGIAFYTARTQYQLYLAAVKAQGGPVETDSDDGEE